MKNNHPPIEKPALQILLVEDDPAHAEIVRRNLSSLPVAHHLTHLEDGQEALDYFFLQVPVGRPLPDLVLLDLRLPKVDGLDVLRKIRAEDRLKEIPIVVLTTSAARADISYALSLGATSYQLKPMACEGFIELFGTDPPPSLDSSRFRKNID